MTPTYQPPHWLGGDHSNQSPQADAIVRDVLIAAAIILQGAHQGWRSWPHG